MCSALRAAFFRLARVDVDDLDEVAIDVTQPIMPMGSYTLATIGARRGWRPGAQLHHLDDATWSQAWPSTSLLNPHARVVRFADADVVVTGDEQGAFIRPVEDSKAFAGKVYERGEWRGFKQRVLSVATSADPLHGDTLVVIAPPVVIHTETRCWVVGGEIVTVSGYKRGKQVISTPGADDEVIAFAKQCIAQWTPNEAFVLDIAQTPTGCRIVEVNCLNAAGFYAADTTRLIDALEAHRW
ncbi:MAG TPA: ATP-grasp domain-containing protein [Myxococcota bacterium]